MKFTTTREVTRKECHWLREDIPEGTTLYKFTGATYGVIGDGIAMTMDGDTPFFEIPRDAIVLDEEQ